MLWAVGWLATCSGASTCFFSGDESVRIEWMAVMLAACLVGVASAQGGGRTIAVCAADGIALGGNDLVSYFTGAAPTAGLPEFRVEHGGLGYLFASAENRDAFIANPERYLPAYGGWCATTVALGALACPDFSNYKIEDGRLLLFETAAFTNGRALWDTDPPGYRRRADSSYPQLTAQ
jgi:hypothetical protein